MALPSLAALRLGQGPERDTAGQASTFRSAIAARARWSRYANPVAGKERCPVSFDDFEDGDPIWIGESGHYYHPWVYYRAYKTTGRDPCGNLPIPEAEVKRLERELSRINAVGRLASASERQKWAAEEANKVLLAAEVDAAMDDVDAENQFELELAEALLGEGRGYSEGDDASGGFRGENYTHAELQMLRTLLDADEDTRDVRVPIDTSSHLRTAHPGSNFLWTNPLAGGKLSIRWHVQYTPQPDASFGSKSSMFVLNLRLGEGKLFTNLLLAHASPAWQLLERSPTDFAQWNLGERGSLLTLRSLVLKALLIGDRRDAPLPLTDAQIDALAGRLDELDFEVAFQEPRGTEWVRGAIFSVPPRVRVAVSVALMSALLAPGIPRALQERAAAQWFPHPPELLPSPPAHEGWGNLDDATTPGLPPGWEPGSSATGPLRARADRNWTNGATRMMQLMNNLVTLTLQVPPNNSPPRYVMEPVSGHMEDLQSPERSNAHLAYAVPGPERTTVSAAGGERAHVHHCSVRMPFWYALDLGSGGLNERVDLGNGMRVAQINGRAGIPVLLV